MKNIIEAIYNGEICPLEQLVLNDQTYQNHMKKQTDAFDKLASSLSEKETAMLERYLNKRNQTEAYLHPKLFRLGFSIGLQIFLDALNNNYSLYNQ